MQYCHESIHILFFNFLFCIGIWEISNVMIVSGEQIGNSAIHIHVSILPQTSLPSRLPHNIEQSSLCCIVGPCWLSILNIAVTYILNVFKCFVFYNKVFNSVILMFYYVLLNIPHVIFVILSFLAELPYNQFIIWLKYLLQKCLWQKCL